VEKYLRRVIRIGGSVAVVLPKTLVEKLSDYVWVMVDSDGVLRIERARVE